MCTPPASTGPCSGLYSCFCTDGVKASIQTLRVRAFPFSQCRAAAVLWHSLFEASEACAKAYTLYMMAEEGACRFHCEPGLCRTTFGLRALPRFSHRLFFDGSRGGIS